MKGKIKQENETRRVDQTERGRARTRLSRARRILLEEKIRVEERRLRGVLVKYLGCDEI